MSWLTETATKTLYFSTPLLALYLAVLLLSPTAYLQRFALYAHKIPISWFQNLNIPESSGFLRGQVTPFFIQSTGAVKLYAWLITPLSVYAKNEDALLAEPATPAKASEDITGTLAFRLLKENSNARVIIYFHGNAGTIGQAWRTDSYRLLSGLPGSAPTYILAFDYRGFGYSTGEPTEKGAIDDAVAVVKWVVDVAGVESGRICLVGQSFGTAVALGVAHYFATNPSKGSAGDVKEFAGIVLGAAFSDAGSIFLSYSIGGLITPLAPLLWFPAWEKWFKRGIIDRWDSKTRVEELVRRSRSKNKRLRLTFVHCESDGMVPRSHCEVLWGAATGALGEVGQPGDGNGEGVEKSRKELGEGGVVDVWTQGDVVIRKEIVRYGGHDNIMKWMAIPLAVYRSFGLE